MKAQGIHQSVHSGACDTEDSDLVQIKHPGFLDHPSDDLTSRPLLDLMPASYASTANTPPNTRGPQDCAPVLSTALSTLQVLRMGGLDRQMTPGGASQSARTAEDYVSFSGQQHQTVGSY